MEPYFYLIGLAMALIGGLMLSRLTKLIHLPAVTAYLVAGLIFGAIGVFLFQLPDDAFDKNETLKMITQTALGFIAFTIGNEFRLSQLKATGKKAITIGVLQAVITTIVVDIILIALHFCFPNVVSIPCALVLGAIASATAPAATLMVIKQYKAEGPLTKLLMLVVAIDDAVGLVLFSVSFGVAKALSHGEVSILAIAVEPIIEIMLSLALGCVMGWLLNWVEQFFHSRSRRLTISVAFVLLTVGISFVKFSIGPIHCGFSLLLACMMTGTIFCNICETSEELMNRVDSWTMPLNVLFFVISGACLNLKVLVHPITLIIGIVYLIARSAGKYYGSNLSCRLTSQPKPITDNLGITLLPQAGVALGMVEMASEELTETLQSAGSVLTEGEFITNIILFAVLIYELVGPSLTKRSLTLVGEIRPEGRTSARTINIK